MMKLFAGLLVLAAVAMGAAMVIGGRVPAFDRSPSPPVATPSPSPTTTPAPAPVASPTDTFVIHDAAPAAPAAAANANAAPSPDALGAAIDRLRTGAPPDATMTVTAPTTPVIPTPDPLLAGPNPAPSVLAGPTTPPAPATPPAPPVPNWTSVTSQGVRWHGSPSSLQIDMGASRVATVQVDPAFQSLPQEAANMRIDYIKQTILENFPAWATQFRFARDGSVALLR